MFWVSVLLRGLVLSAQYCARKSAVMPWKECKPIDERLKFIARLLDGEKMAAVCRDFHVSRKTGYKILNRYNSCGLEELTDRSRRPYRHANQFEPLLL